MNYERFEEILKEEGINNEELISHLWEDCPFPHEELKEGRLRETTQWFVRDERFKEVI